VTLVDTSIWVNHFRSGIGDLEALLTSRLAGVHPFVVGEVACGNLAKRAEVLANLGKLPSAPMASEAEVHYLLDSRRLWGKGLGWVDLHLLASSLICGWRLWTADAALDSAASMLKIRRQPTA
jgi:predicted nucleic acid-binding protein